MSNLNRLFPVTTLLATLFPALLLSAVLVPTLLISAMAHGQGQLGGGAPQDEPTVPSLMTFPANSKFTQGQVRLIYLGQPPYAYISLSNMPDGVVYFRIRLNDELAPFKLRIIEKAAEHNWPLGVYHQPRKTTNYVDALYLVAEVPPGNPDRP